MITYFRKNDHVNFIKYLFLSLAVALIFWTVAAWTGYRLVQPRENPGFAAVTVSLEEQTETAPLAALVKASNALAFCAYTLDERIE